MTPPTPFARTRLGPAALAMALALLPLMGFSTPAAAQTPACRVPDAGGLGGAYRTSAGAVLSILPAGAEGRWRITHFDSGRSHQLYPIDAAQFQSAGDLDAQHPVAFRYRFERDEQGVAQSLAISGRSGPERIARRVPLVDRPVRFTSGDIVLQGRLTLPPPGDRPFKAVVFVHGSDPVPSAGLEWLPHLLASSGVATLVFDKRGTGCSQGQYVQHFDVLADDVVAAVRWLATQPEIDPGQIGLAGFSQGGWVAPLAALKLPAVKFVAVGYGLAMSMADEDRLEAPLKLKQLGVDDASIEEFKALNATLHELARTGFQDWTRFEQ